MNVARVFELAETANSTELVWLWYKVSEGSLQALTNTSPAFLHDCMIFHRLYGKKVVAIIVEWGRQGLRHEEVVESVAESMRTRLEA